MIETAVKEAAKKKAQAAALGFFLKFGLPALLIIGSFFGLLFLLMMVFGGSTDDKGGIMEEGEVDSKLVSAEVMQYQPLVAKYAKQHKIEDKTGIILALMMQESGGRGNDPMQASESKCGSIGCISNPEESIEQGVKYFSQVLKRAKGDVKLTLQSYNFGEGFIDYAMKHGGKYTQQLAIDFSAMMYKKVPDPENYSCVRPEGLQYGACYGDIFYVDAVLQYYSFDNPTGSGGSGDYGMPVDSIKITSTFGYRTLGGQPDLHAGLDFACVKGVTPIKAIAPGKVEISQWSDSFGNFVSIKHDKSLDTRYGHMTTLKVRPGQTVKKGDVLGICGTTGWSTGPHLHLDVIKNGEKIDPQKFLGL